MQTPKYPDVRVQLSGRDGNAFEVIGSVVQALRKHVSREEADAFRDEAYAQHSYDDLLATACKWVDCH